MFGNLLTNLVRKGTSLEKFPLNPKMVVNYKKLKGVSCIVLCKPGEEKAF